MFRDVTIAETDKLAQAPALAARLSCLTLLFLDAELAGRGTAALEQLHGKIPGVPIMLVGPTSGDGDIVAAVSRGAKGFLVRSSSREVTRLAIQLVLAGDTYVPGNAFVNLSSPALPTAQPHPMLSSAIIEQMSPRERSVLEHMLNGRPNKDIAYRLGLAEATVKGHVQSIMRKLGVTNRTEAVASAVRQGCMPTRTV
jgi:DNA-binding NarL/FixJ family response regulator